MNHIYCDAGGILSKILSAVLLLTVVFSAGTVSAQTSKGVWWWRGEDVARPDEAARRMEFLGKHAVTEIYFCADLKRTRHDDIRRFIKAAHGYGMRVACLNGDVSWIRPAAPDEKFYALHLDVEPHQDSKLSDARKWQLYADFVLRAAADVHAAGEKIEWDIPFWLDDKRVAYGDREDAPLLDVLTENSDCITLMSYRDTAAAMLDVSKTEIGMAAKGKVRVVLGAETGETGEGGIVTFFEEGAAKMDAELAKVSAALDAEKVPAGAGIAIHHLGGWEKLVEKENGK